MREIIQENIMRELGLENMPENEKEEVLEEMASIVFQNVLLRVLDAVGEKEQETIKKLFEEKGGTEEILKILNSSMENLEEIIKEEVNRLKETIQKAVAD